MEDINRRHLLEFLDDLTDTQISRLVYFCLTCSSAEIARHRNISKQAVNQSIQQIHDRRIRQELIAAIQEALSNSGFML